MSKVILVTGSNTGIGYELVHLLAALPEKHTVYLASRKLDAGRAAVEKAKKEKGVSLKFVQLDIADPKTIEAAVATIKSQEGRLDVLVNNAGIAEMSVQQSATNPNIPALRNTFETNVVGTINNTTAFLPLLRAAASSGGDPAVILNISTDMASNTFMASPQGFLHQVLSYNTSKAAANAYTIALARELRDAGENIKVNAMTPGFTTTALNGFRAGGKTPEQGAKLMLPWIFLGKDGKTGEFSALFFFFVFEGVG
ncbi:hypothetical protein HMN09_01323700 [Mycena chlorophos]|uniref:NAD(P)-binding protein n=1 Tax=Mycena chlorophos TaxID=658473 RepID=A0A8H6S1K0_MYCCL|nr:hypothetical protein HMN09_01323700 [Mycena chlorophos]